MSMGNFSSMTLNKIHNKTIFSSGELRPKNVATSSQSERFPLLSEYTDPHTLLQVSVYLSYSTLSLDKSNTNMI